MTLNTLLLVLVHIVTIRTRGHTCLIEQEVFGVAAEALLFACARAAETALVTGIALAVLIGEHVQRAVTEELAVAVHILPHAGSTGEAGGRMRTRARQAGLITLSTLCSVQVCFWRALDQTLSVVTNISIMPTGGAVIFIRSITFCTVTVTQRTQLLLSVCEVALGTVTHTLILMQEVVLFTRTAFVHLVTFGATVWTDLTYSIFYKVPGRALKHTGVFQTHIVFLTAQTKIGLFLT